MPQSSASPLSSRQAAVFDFLPALARRHFASRVGARGTVQVFGGPAGVVTLVHQRRLCGSSEVVEDRFAQLRLVAGGDGYQLFWKKGNGRWTSYCGLSGDTFVGSVGECFGEVARDPFGCFWS
jgi:hypothetical protein